MKTQTNKNILNEKLPPVVNGKLPYSRTDETTRDIPVAPVDFNKYGGPLKIDSASNYKTVKLDQNDVAYQERLDGMERQVTTPSGGKKIAPKIMKTRDGIRDEIRQNGK